MRPLLSLTRRLLAVRLLWLITATATLSGCSVLSAFDPAVSIKEMTPEAYIARQRGDMLTTGKLSAQTIQTIQVTGLDLNQCASPRAPACTQALQEVQGISDERKLSALAELWLQLAMLQPNAAATGANPTQGIENWLMTARYAYAYLFFTPRSPGERAFEERQTQVRDWYNYAVQKAITQLFHARKTPGTAAQPAAAPDLGEWSMPVDMKIRLPNDSIMPQDLLPASSLSFQGLRSMYRRDGFGAELVAILQDDPVARAYSGEDALAPELPAKRQASRPPDWSEMPSPNITVLFHFNSNSLEELMQDKQVMVTVHDPLIEDRIALHGQDIPLAGNYTSGYGVWLARAGFNTQSLRSLFGRERGIDRPHLYMMQPFDPDRRIILMLHGLASSPEAWVNVANEIMGDEALRNEFQVWQVYYPTNIPVVLNHRAIRKLLADALKTVDPNGQAAASQGMVLIGHSMGGMISRLMVSSADTELWDWALSEGTLEPELVERIQPRLDPTLRFEPFPGVERAVFIAAPHRGTAVANHSLARWVAGFIRLPLTVIENIDDALQARADEKNGGREAFLKRLPTSIDNLNEHDSFVKAAAKLPISDQVEYHSIIARTQPDGPLEKTDDGLVPYASSHLPEAVSEKVIISGHSVQETAAAILEIRRILHEDIAQRQDPGQPQP